MKRELIIPVLCCLTFGGLGFILHMIVHDCPGKRIQIKAKPKREIYTAGYTVIDADSVIDCHGHRVKFDHKTYLPQYESQN